MPKPPSAWRWLIAPAVLCMAALSGPEARPQAPAIKEYEIKAVFLLNFAQFVEWPAHAFANDTAPLTLGVLGEDPFGNILDRTVQGETIKGRPLAVKRFKRIEDVQDCHLLFISRSEKARVPQILSRLAGTSILTVGETDQFARSGGIINFRIQGNNVRFEINVDAAARSHLKISSKLLRLATIITNGRAKEGG
ncbi:MAG: YfiR family protein [Verrucomicrobia bacterium]|nr:YfiR family protein [Verrucomicrobiota bacterium]